MYNIVFSLFLARSYKKTHSYSSTTINRRMRQKSTGCYKNIYKYTPILKTLPGLLPGAWRKLMQVRDWWRWKVTPKYSLDSGGGGEEHVDPAEEQTSQLQGLTSAVWILSCVTLFWGHKLVRPEAISITKGMWQVLQGQWYYPQEFLHDHPAQTCITVQEIYQCA